MEFLNRLSSVCTSLAGMLLILFGSKDQEIPNGPLGLWGGGLQRQNLATIACRARLPLGPRGSPLVHCFRMCKGPLAASSQVELPRHFLYRPHTDLGRVEHWLLKGDGSQSPND